MIQWTEYVRIFIKYYWSKVYMKNELKNTRNINKIKNKLGTSKVVVVSSQLGVPIAVYGGEIRN